MMFLKSLLLVTLLPSMSLKQGTDSWSVTLNGKKVLNTSTEEETKNVVTIKPASLKGKNTFIVTYREQPVQKDWERFIALETTDTTLKQVKGKELRITNAALQGLFKKSKTIEVYSWSLPKDPDLRMRVRIRRVHLATLKVEG